MRLRHMEIVIGVDKLNVDIENVLGQLPNLYEWAYILHDKDNTRPHYHIYLKFYPTPADTKDVAKWFKLGYTGSDDVRYSGEQFIGTLKGSKMDIVLYLVHRAPFQQNKYQYSLNEVVSNFDFISEVVSSFTHESVCKLVEFYLLGRDERLSNDERINVVGLLNKVLDILDI